MQNAMTKDGDSCIAFKNVKYNTWLHSDGKDKLGCSNLWPDKNTKFFGWREISSWTIANVEYDIDSGKMSVLPSKVVGSTVNDNRGGSTPN